MSEKEKAIVEKIKKAIPKMSEFDKGYFLGKVENLADEGKSKEEDKSREETKTYWLHLLPLRLYLQSYVP